MTRHAIHTLALLGTAKSAYWAESAGLVDAIEVDVDQGVERWARAVRRVDTRRVVELREWTSTARSGAFEEGAMRSARALSEPWVRELARAFVQEGDAPWLR